MFRYLATGPEPKLSRLSWLFLQSVPTSFSFIGGTWFGGFTEPGELSEKHSLNLIVRKAFVFFGLGPSF